MNRADVWMIQRRSGPRLACETLQRDGIAGQLFRQKLQRDHAAKLEVLGPIDHPHTAAANDVDDAIMGNLFPYEGLGTEGWSCRRRRRAWLWRHDRAVPPLHRHHEPLPAACQLLT